MSSLDPNTLRSNKTFSRCPTSLNISVFSSPQTLQFLHNSKIAPLPHQFSLSFVSGTFYTLSSLAFTITLQGTQDYPHLTRRRVRFKEKKLGGIRFQANVLAELSKPVFLLLHCASRFTQPVAWKLKGSVAQSCPTLCDPMDCSPPGSSAHDILQARILEWVAMHSFRGSSLSRDWTYVSYSTCIGRWVLYH